MRLGIAFAVLLSACGDDGGSGEDAGGRDAGDGDAGTGTDAGPGDGGSDAGSDAGGVDAGGSGCEAIDLGFPTVAITLPAGCPGDGCTTTGLVPLDDLAGDYQGLPGRLYCGSNERPAAHEAAGLAIARGIGPRAADGTPDPAGRYVLVSIGMSNTTQEFQAFLTRIGSGPGVTLDPSLVVVDGALGGQASQQWASLGGMPWANLDMRLEAAGVTREQVAVAWVKLARIMPGSACPSGPCFPDDIEPFYDEVRTTLLELKRRLPNLALVYLTSRIYAGYATTQLNPEPYSYQAAFAMKALILDQITGDPGLNYDPARGAVTVPWLAWGPYLWADGLTTRSDGLVWERADLAMDGTHPSDAGRRKVANLLLDFFSTDSTAREWFLAAP